MLDIFLVHGLLKVISEGGKVSSFTGASTNRIANANKYLAEAGIIKRSHRQYRLTDNGQRFFQHLAEAMQYLQPK